MPTTTLEFRKLKQELFPLTVTYFDGEGLEVWSGSLDHPGAMEAPVFGPGRVHSIRVEYADGSYNDELVDTPESSDRRRNVRTLIAVAALAVFIVVWAIDFTQSHQRQERKIEQEIDDILRGR